MAKRGRDWNKLYANYSKKWDAMNKKLPNGMYQEKFDKRAFRNTYVLLENSRMQEQEEGLRGKSLNVMRDLINAQKYRWTQGQARSITKALRKAEIQKLDVSKLTKKEYKEAIKKINKEISFIGVKQETIKTGKFWESVKERYQQLMTDPTYQGFWNDSYARAQIISSEFFGS